MSIIIALSNVFGFIILYDLFITEYYKLMILFSFGMITSVFYHLSDGCISEGTDHIKGLYPFKKYKRIIFILYCIGSYSNMFYIIYSLYKVDVFFSISIILKNSGLIISIIILGIISLIFKKYTLSNTGIWIHVIAHSLGNILSFLLFSIVWSFDYHNYIIELDYYTYHNNISKNV